MKANILKLQSASSADEIAARRTLAAVRTESGQGQAPVELLCQEGGVHTPMGSGLNRPLARQE